MSVGKKARQDDFISSTLPIASSPIRPLVDVHTSVTMAFLGASPLKKFNAPFCTLDPVALLPGTVN